jgi:hypothetical protein
MPATAAQDEGKTMKKLKLDRLVASLGEVRDHVATGRFAGRITKLDSAAEATAPGGVGRLRDSSWHACAPILAKCCVRST